MFFRYYRTIKLQRLPSKEIIRFQTARNYCLNFDNNYPVR